MSNPENPQAANQPEELENPENQLEELEELEEELTGDDLNSISGGPAGVASICTSGTGIISSPGARCTCSGY
uniref:Uncharacterized protein n=1 Tax=Cyanothece sp. (strain PCC 7425 / ATCC 29141) TaxID=395961 RepID=B8HL09_CYAP4